MKGERKAKKKNSTLTFSPWTMKETRSELKELLDFVISYFSMPTTVEETLLFIFEEEKGEQDLCCLQKKFISHVSEPELINTVYRLIHHTWLYFPHHILNGMSPLEMIEQKSLEETKK